MIQRSCLACASKVQSVHAAVTRFSGDTVGWPRPASFSGGGFDARASTTGTCLSFGTRGHSALAMASHIHNSKQTSNRPCLDVQCWGDMYVMSRGELWEYSVSVQLCSPCKVSSPAARGGCRGIDAKGVAGTSAGSLRVVEPRYC